MTPEFDLIQRYFSRPAKNALLGVGDDCALYATAQGMVQAISTDMLVEGRHFIIGADAEKLGRKSLAVNLSDLAAMGAEPRFVTLALALPDANENWLEAFARGFFAQADKHGIELIGGDTTRGPLTISITVIGEVPLGMALRRDAAQVGDEVWLSGATGEAALALAHQERRTRIAQGEVARCFARLDDPQPRVELGSRLRGIAHAAIDISDGLIADLGHIAERSGVDIHIAADHLPVSAALAACDDVALRRLCIAAGGDDYELAFTAPQAAHQIIEKLSKELGVALTMIGNVLPGAGMASLRDAAGKPIALARTGFDHFGA
ncbi:MAG: thiamine-phosphate kinase [Burkholderiales bacterium]